jgi:DNA-binding transcriptional MerR regulator
MDKKQLIHSVRNKEYNTIDELVIEAARIIPHIAQEQKRYKVAVYPDERTIRYYINEGLVDRPSPSKDNPSRFTYRHLLQILAIKHLQAQYLPLNKIKEMLNSLDIEELEEIITGGREETSEYASFSSPMRRRAALQNMIQEPLSLSFQREIKEYTLPSIEPDIPEEWVRISVTDDIELNVRSSSIPKSSGEKKEFLERLTAKLRIYLESEKNKGGT